jgi:hypothetical protein
VQHDIIYIIGQAQGKPGASGTGCRAWDEIENNHKNLKF